jgi:hypothetical protein
MPANPASDLVPAALRSFVRESLCAKENLLVDQFELTESPLLRRGRVCGVQFTLFGPRSVRLMAIWDADRGRVLCYDAGGERFSETPIVVTSDRAAA